MDGHVLPEVRGRIGALRSRLVVHLVSADTYGRLAEIAAELDVQATRLRPGDETAQKAAFVRELGAESVAAIGNGASDVGMLRWAGLGIGALGHEGAAVAAIQVADIVVGSANQALDLLLNPVRLAATLRR